MRNSLGSKRKELSPAHIDDITRIFGEFQEVTRDGVPISRVFRNEDFGYRTITIERPKRGAAGEQRRAVEDDAKAVPPSLAGRILEGAYEATLWAAVLNAQRTGSNVVFLTQLGGGALGNAPAWIHGAIRRALRKVQGVGLDVRLVSYKSPDAALVRLVAEFA